MDMSQYLDLFLEESMENVQKLNQGLLTLESDPEKMEAIDEVFRAAHTLKGMSATMGYENVAQLTHKMENLLEKLRDREISFNPAIFTALFKSVDTLERILTNIRQGTESNLDVSLLSEELIGLEQVQPLSSDNEALSEKDACLDSDQSSQGEILILNEYDNNLLAVVREKGQYAYQIKVSIDQGCVMKGVRAFIVFRNLESIGEIIKVVPPVQDLEDEKFDRDFVVILITNLSPEQVRENIESISEVKTEYIQDITPGYKGTGVPEQVNNRSLKGVTKSPMPGSAAPDAKNTNGDKKQKLHQTVRVDIGRLDKLMSLVGELVINKTRLEQIYTTNNLGELNEAVEQIDRITTDLQNVVQNVRMVSIEQVFNRFPRMVRDLAKELDKEVNLIVEGKDTELDRTVIDEIGDPLVHLIRNAIDHGLEPTSERLALGKPAEGMLKLSAKHEGNRVMINVEDDGQGINVEHIRRKALENNLITPYQAENMEDSAILDLIFEPGFSTAREITDISGRGVGLDVVRSKIQALNGQISLDTKLGQGTRFIIKLPLTLAIIQALLVKVQEEFYAIPLGTIDETTSLETGMIKNIQGQQVMVLREKVLPLVFLKQILNVPGDLEKSEMYVVVVRKGEQQFGLVVDELVGQQDIVINSLGKLLTGIKGLAGASILGDGRISLILDIGSLF